MKWIEKSLIIIIIPIDQLKNSLRESLQTTVPAIDAHWKPREKPIEKGKRFGDEWHNNGKWQRSLSAPKNTPKLQHRCESVQHMYNREN